MNEAVAPEKAQDQETDPLDAPYIVRRKNQNPSGTSNFKPWIEVEPGTDILELLHRSRDLNVLSRE